MSANEVRITCGLGAWHDGHRDKVLAIAVREPDPLKADAPGWRFLTGPELRGDLAEMERRAGPIVDSTDRECLNCYGDSILANRLGNTDPHSENCRVIRPLCKCGWPGPAVRISDLLPSLEEAASSAQSNMPGYVDIRSLYPFDVSGGEHGGRFLPEFTRFRFWENPDRAELRRAQLAGAPPRCFIERDFDFYVMCDGREGTASRAWHRRNGSSRVATIRYAGNGLGASIKGLRRIDCRPVVNLNDRPKLVPDDPDRSPLEQMRLEAEEWDRLNALGRAPDLVPQSWIDPLDQPVFSSDFTLTPVPELDRGDPSSLEDAAKSENMATSLDDCPCGRSDMPVWFGMYVNPWPFKVALDAGIHVLSVEGFRRLLESTGDLIR